MSVCMSAVSAGISEVLIKCTGKYVKIYFIMKITYTYIHSIYVSNVYTGYSLYTHIHTYIHTYIHTHTYTHTHVW